MVNYNKRLVEVDEILNHLSEDNLQKIPEDIRRLIKDNKDSEYIWEYDETKSLNNQNLSRDTIIILSYLNMEYLLNEEQKKLMQQIHELNERKMEEEKLKKYYTDDLFKKSKLEEKKEDIEQIQQSSLVIHKESFFKKIINKIKRFFIK